MKEAAYKKVESQSTHAETQEAPGSTGWLRTSKKESWVEAALIMAAGAVRKNQKTASEGKPSEKLPKMVNVQGPLTK